MTISCPPYASIYVSCWSNLTSQIRLCFNTLPIKFDMSYYYLLDARVLSAIHGKFSMTIYSHTMFSRLANMIAPTGPPSISRPATRLHAEIIVERTVKDKFLETIEELIEAVLSAMRRVLRSLRRRVLHPEYIVIYFYFR